MASILTARDLAKSYSSHTLFTGVALGLARGDRVGLIGPNGSGKSTLLKILAGLEPPDGGDITRRRQLRLAYVAQDDRFADGVTPLSAVAGRLPQDAGHERLDGETRAAITLSRLGFVDLHQPVSSLSGGWRKRLSIACALAGEPDVLLLDEPTNHLDLEGVLWLERFVKQAAGAVVVVTHDRVFLENIATRIVELSATYPGGTFEVQGNYSQFVRRRGQFLDAQVAGEAVMAGRVRRDTAWLEQGIQGRQTRNKSQAAAAELRRGQLKDITHRNKAPTRTTAIDFQATDRKTKNLLVAHRLSKSMGARLLFDRLDLTLSPGMRLGLLGPNGSGKTTLLRLLAGDLQPDSGTLKRAAGLRLTWFTQHREALNLTQDLRRALCPVGDTVFYRGKAVHVAAWAKKFLFDPGKFNTSVGDLSGGEQARILIARLMLKPADILFLDEPTNDLDIPSLEVLEQALTEFPGAIVLVTHDRFMLGRISTSVLALDGCGRAKSFATYDQWRVGESQRKPSTGDRPAGSAKPKPPADPAADTKPREAASRKKLSYKLQRELDGIDQTILAAEAELQALEAQSADPAVVADQGRHREVCRKLGLVHERVRQHYERWAELEAMRESC